MVTNADQKFTLSEGTGNARLKAKLALLTLDYTCSILFAEAKHNMRYKLFSIDLSQKGRIPVKIWSRRI